MGSTYYWPKIWAINLEAATKVLSYLTDLISVISIKALIYSFYWAILSDKSGIGLFSGSVFSKKFDHTWLVFFSNKSGRSLKFAPCDYPNECLEKATTFNQAFSSKKLYIFPEGFGLDLIS